MLEGTGKCKGHSTVYMIRLCADRHADHEDRCVIKLAMQSLALRWVQNSPEQL